MWNNSHKREHQVNDDGFAVDNDISMNIQPLSSAEQSAISPTALGLQASSNASQYYPNKYDQSTLRYQQPTHGASLCKEMIIADSAGRASSGRNGRGRRQAR